MKDASYYGEAFADIYDDLYPFIPSGAIDTLTSMGDPQKKVLELGIGTGRFAIPLAKRGVDITGVDASPTMLEVLERKTNGLAIEYVLDDFSKLENVSSGPFTLAFCNFSSFFLLLDQEKQISCFKRTSELLEPGGRFILEVYTPDLNRYASDQPIFAEEFRGDKEVFLEASHHNSIKQRVSCRFIRISTDKIRVVPVELRYCWPSELDLMGRLAGLTLEHRWANWEKEPFRATSGRHISVYVKNT